ncbi:dGTPase [Shewanella submarina]|uniref:Probable deoxyguanosinetriphosphate triphosphohydrolase n=1 Tax=Shewanella submarina TaxID=2016376 RepID=A0ABV7GHJ5_9GAMM|nr:dGTPase [Shewanella submarina]MCL1038131.1 dGTPase [Shewanella submarina]
MIDFRSKILAHRPYGEPRNLSGRSLQRQFESDRGRIINSAAIRRLQQKTQVFPLERNAAVRSRLTHSLEVQQTGRFIVQTIFDRLSDTQLAQYGLTDMENSVESLVEMGCLMHDVGNPPFGHFGEAAINDWFSRYIPALFPAEVSALLPTRDQLMRDVCQFEGNAQAIRLLQNLLGLNLTWSQAAIVMKYTRPAIEPKPAHDDALSYLKKKPGWYFSEQSYIERLCAALEITQGHRHPLAYIMEAADDISYCLADIEDAVEKDILSLNELESHLLAQHSALIEQWQLPDKGILSGAISYASEQAQRQGINHVSQFFTFLRVKLIHPLVKHAANRFLDNIEAVFHGNFNQALLEDRSPAHAITETLKQVAFKQVFCHKEVERMELKGYKVITGLLDAYRPLLELSEDEFMALSASGKKPLVASRLYNKLPGKHKATYHRALKDAQVNHCLCPGIEFYHRCRLIQDYISGMTDQFAWDEYRTLMAID